MSTLVPSGRRDDLEALSARARELEAALAGRSVEFSEAKADLDAFAIRYRQDVGLLHEELDALEAAITEAEIGEAAARMKGQTLDDTAEPCAGAPEAAPRTTTDVVRRLFRDVAKAIHPDLTNDAEARDRRHALMIEANRAYAMGDEERLRRILQSWENRPEAVAGDDPEAVRERLARRIAQIDEQIEFFGAQLAELHGSPMWKLKTMVDRESAKGRDLIADLIRHLTRDIMVARNRLDAIQSIP